MDCLQVMKPDDFQKRWLLTILEAQAAGRKLPGNSALVTGAALGLGSMLGVPDLLPSFPQAFRGPSHGDPKVMHAGLKASKHLVLRCIAAYPKSL